MGADLDTAVTPDTFVVIKIYLLLIMCYRLRGTVFPAFTAKTAFWLITFRPPRIPISLRWMYWVKF